MRDSPLPIRTAVPLASCTPGHMPPPHRPWAQSGLRVCLSAPLRCDRNSIKSGVAPVAPPCRYRRRSTPLSVPRSSCSDLHARPLFKRLHVAATHTALPISRPKRPRPHSIATRHQEVPPACSACLVAPHKSADFADVAAPPYLRRRRNHPQRVAGSRTTPCSPTTPPYSALFQSSHDRQGHPLLRSPRSAEPRPRGTVTAASSSRLGYLAAHAATPRPPDTRHDPASRTTAPSCASDPATSREHAGADGMCLHLIRATQSRGLHPTREAHRPSN